MKVNCIIMTLKLLRVILELISLFRTFSFYGNNAILIIHISIHEKKRKKEKE